MRPNYEVQCVECFQIRWANNKLNMTRLRLHVLTNARLLTYAPVLYRMVEVNVS